MDTFVSFELSPVILEDTSLALGGTVADDSPAVDDLLLDLEHSDTNGAKFFCIIA